MRGKSKRGYATVLAMLMLVLGTTLSAWLYTMVQHATAISHNEQAAARTRMVAESGLAYMQLKLHEVCAATPILVTADQPAMLVRVGNALMAQMPTGTVEVRQDGFGIPSVHVLSSPVRGGTFVASLSLSSVHSTGFRLSVTGTAGSISNTIGVEYQLVDESASAWMSYPMLSHDVMVVDRGAAAVHHWNIKEGRADNTIGVSNPTNDGEDWVMTFDPVAPATVKFPPKYLPDRVYAKLDAMKGTALLPDFAAPGDGTPVKELANRYIPPGNPDPKKRTPIVLGAGATLTGVIYVGYPNDITISDDVRIDGIIIYEKPTAGESESTITVDRNIAAASSPTAITDAMGSLMRLSGETAESAAEYAAQVSPWTIHAPDTSFNMVPGNTGQVDIWGSFHVKDIPRATGDGNGSPDEYVIHGTIVCEEEIYLGGNRTFSLSPESEARTEAKPELLSLWVRPGGYWEE